MLAGRLVLILVAPGVDRDAGLAQVAAGLVVAGIGRFADQRIEALLRRGEDGSVHPVGFDGGVEHLDLDPRSTDAGLVDLRDDRDAHERREQPDDQHHRHDLDQREAAAAAFGPSFHFDLPQPSELVICSRGTSVARMMISTSPTMIRIRKGSSSAVRRVTIVSTCSS